MISKFTNEHLEATKTLEKLTKAFELSPSKKTATVLASFRAKHDEVLTGRGKMNPEYTNKFLNCMHKEFLGFHTKMS